MTVPSGVGVVWPWSPGWVWPWEARGKSPAEIRQEQGLPAAFREIPSWCNWVPFSDYVDVCKPYTQTELEAMAREAKITAPEAERMRLELARRYGQERLIGELPDEGCEYMVSQEEPSLAAMFFSPATICKFRRGQYNTLIAGALLLGGVVALVVLIPKRRRR